MRTQTDWETKLCVNENDPSRLERYEYVEKSGLFKHELLHELSAEGARIIWAIRQHDIWMFLDTWSQIPKQGYSVYLDEAQTREGRPGHRERMMLVTRRVAAVSRLGLDQILTLCSFLIPPIFCLVTFTVITSRAVDS